MAPFHRSPTTSSLPCMAAIVVNRRDSLAPRANPQALNQHVARKRGGATTPRCSCHGTSPLEPWKLETARMKALPQALPPADPWAWSGRRLTSNQAKPVLLLAAPWVAAAMALAVVALGRTAVVAKRSVLLGRCFLWICLVGLLRQPTRREPGGHRRHQAQPNLWRLVRHRRLATLRLRGPEVAATQAVRRVLPAPHHEGLPDPGRLGHSEDPGLPARKARCTGPTVLNSFLQACL